MRPGPQQTASEIPYQGKPWNPSEQSRAEQKSHTVGRSNKYSELAQPFTPSCFCNVTKPKLPDRSLLFLRVNLCDWKGEKPTILIFYMDMSIHISDYIQRVRVFKFWMFASMSNESPETLITTVQKNIYYKADYQYMVLKILLPVSHIKQEPDGYFSYSRRTS